jgi:TPR repeat protein
MKRTIIAAALTLLLTAPVAAADLNKGEAAFKRVDYATALRELRPLAERGYARAQNNLGAMYEGGHGVRRDYAEAYIWYSLAAAAGDKAAEKRRRNAARRLSLDQQMAAEL